MQSIGLNFKSGVLLALSMTLTLCCQTRAVAADAAESSWDSIWMEQQAEKAPGAVVDTTPVRAESAPEPAAAPASVPTAAPVPVQSAAPVDVGETAAPMCQLDTFKNSAIISKGGWPGVGPFKPETEKDFADDKQNKLHVELAGQQITRAELALANKKLSGNHDHDLLDMQMNIDFFLEAVGVAPARIQQLNEDLAKNKEALFTDGAAPLNFNVGRCSLTINRKPASDENKFDFSIAINSLHANEEVLKEHSATEPAPVAQNHQEPVKKAVESAPKTASALPTYTIKAAPAKPAHPAPAAAPAVASNNPLKTQFAELISEWQRVKKDAVRDRQVESLSQVLTGKALIRQTDAIKWLTNNHKYYEMNPKGVTVDKVSELSPSKYLVSARVREAYKFIDDGSGKVLKEVDDVNKVNYTVEKIAGRWLITDSALLPADQASTTKTTR